jgi:hypothetical protein
MGDVRKMAETDRRFVISRDERRQIENKQTQDKKFSLHKD